MGIFFSNFDCLSTDRLDEKVVRVTRMREKHNSRLVLVTLELFRSSFLFVVDWLQLWVGGFYQLSAL